MKESNYEDHSQTQEESAEEVELVQGPPVKSEVFQFPLNSQVIKEDSQEYNESITSKKESQIFLLSTEKKKKSSAQKNVHNQLYQRGLWKMK